MQIGPVMCKMMVELTTNPISNVIATKNNRDLLVISFYSKDTI